MPSEKSPRGYAPWSIQSTCRLSIALLCGTLLAQGCRNERPSGQKTGDSSIELAGKSPGQTSDPGVPPTARDAGRSPGIDAGVDGVDAGRAGPPPRVIQLALGYRHTCALSEAGTVRCWGHGKNGRLGYSNTTSIGDNEPVWTAGDVRLGGPAAHLATGSRHTCALMQSGAVRCWGGNQHGQLGHGHTDDIGDDETPESAGDIRLGGRAVQVDAGGSISCALLDDGRVRCWGYGREGGLGRGKMPDVSIGDDEHPDAAPPLDIPARITEIALGRNAGCALLKDSNVRCWGYQPGRKNSVRRKPSEEANVRIGAPVQHLSAAASYTCAVLKNRSMRCWGEQGSAVLGYPGREFIGLDEGFARLGDVDVGGKVREVAIGNKHMCVALQGGDVRCWGANSTGQLGRGDKVIIGDDEPPASAPVVDVGGPVQHIAAGGSASCALLDSGAVRCWGYNRDGQLGYGHTQTIGDDETPASAGDVPVFGAAP